MRALTQPHVARAGAATAMLIMLALEGGRVDEAMN